MTTAVGTIATAAALRQAAELIETDGWVQGDYKITGQGYCARGALRQVIFGEAWPQYADPETPMHRGGAAAPSLIIYSEALTCVEAMLDNKSLIAFNDAPGRLKEEIVNLLRWSAERCES